MVSPCVEPSTDIVTHSHFLNRPQGVGMGRKPQVWMKDGDVAEVYMDGVGTCVNRIAFEKPAPKL